jgi:hypothetical protein
MTWRSETRDTNNVVRERVKLHIQISELHRCVVPGPASQDAVFKRIYALLGLQCVSLAKCGTGECPLRLSVRTCSIWARVWTLHTTGQWYSIYISGKDIGDKNVSRKNKRIEQRWQEDGQQEYTSVLRKMYYVLLYSKSHYLPLLFYHWIHCSHTRTYL